VKKNWYRKCIYALSS